MKANLSEYVISHDRKGFSNVIHLMILRVEDYSRLPRGDTLLNPEGKNTKWRVRLREGDAVTELEPGETVPSQGAGCPRNWVQASSHGVLSPMGFIKTLGVRSNKYMWVNHYICDNLSYSEW